MKRDPSQRAVEFRKLLRRFLDVCNAIDYAHSRGVLHRNLKPGNIMLGKYGETLVVDWGLAKLLSRPETDDQASEGPVAPPSASGSGATQMGSMIGTPAFMSPEQAAGRIDLLGPASDVYSLGATLYYVLTNRAPFDGSDVGVVLQNVQRGDFPPPRKLDATIARPLEAICLKAMALKPEDRYASPRALADDIEHWLADEPVTAYCDPLLARILRTARRHKVATTSVSALLLAAVVGLSIGTVLLGQEQARTAKARDAESKARQEAENNLERATAAQKAEQAARHQAQRQLALSYIDQGVNELEYGDRLQGYAILGQAYREASESPDLRASAVRSRGLGLRLATCIATWRLCHGRGVQPGRDEDRHRELGRNGAAMEHGDRPTVGPTDEPRRRSS